MSAIGVDIESLPPLFARWMAELLPGPVPRETRATCHDCAMCANEPEAQKPSTDYFDPLVKCCTYVPVLHNFLIGRILSDDDPNAATGRESVEKRIKEGVALTPLGLDHPPVFSLLYGNNDGAFGHSRALRCPHFVEDDGGRCSIWSNRESTCATWFCKHVRGAVGYSFWREGLHELLMNVENDLARWCVLELNLGGAALRHLSKTGSWRGQSELASAKSLDNRRDQYEYDQVWGEWAGREMEFFVACAQRVNTLRWNDVLSICGPEARAHAQLTVAAYQRLVSMELPSSLKVGDLQLVQIKRDVTRLTTYSSSDPIDVPKIVMDSLPHFDGRSPNEALAAIANETGVEIDLSLVRKLVDFEVLLTPS